MHKTGGLTVCHHLNEMYGWCGFFINPYFPEHSIEYFKSLPKYVRYSYRAIYGHQAIQLLPFVHPDTLAASLLRDPVSRVVSLYKFCLTHQFELHNAFCRTHTLAQCVEQIPEFGNYYSDNFDPDAYDRVFLSPEELLRHIGFTGDVVTINKSNPQLITDDDIAAVIEGNQLDIAIYDQVKARLYDRDYSR